MADINWGAMADGLFGAGSDWYKKKKIQEEDEARLARAQGPLYNAQVGAAQTNLNLAGGFDPNAHAAERFAEQQRLLQPVKEKNLADLQRNLYKKGLLGVANYNPGIEGYTPTNQAVNPHMAAFYAAQAAQESKDAYASLDQGQQYLDKLLNRSTNLSNAATVSQTRGIQAQEQLGRKPDATGSILKTIGGVASSAGLFDMVGKGINSILGGGATAAAPAPGLNTSNYGPAIAGPDVQQYDTSNWIPESTMDWGSVNTFDDMFTGDYWRDFDGSSWGGYDW